MGIARVDQKLPAPVYALLTGLNAATVGIIALAAVQLSQKAITDKLTRILVFFGGTAGILYNALWYFPVLMVVGGVSTIVWDYHWLQRLVGSIRRPTRQIDPDSESLPQAMESVELSSEARLRRPGQASAHPDPQSCSNSTTGQVDDNERIVPPTLELRVVSWEFGAIVIAAFFASFIVIMTLRGIGNIDERGFNLFANLYLAGTRSFAYDLNCKANKIKGTIIFGGGPVVIPLLRESVHHIVLRFHG